MTDTEREALCTRINELCAENERLRQENQSIGMAAYELGRKSMVDENAKLRELIVRCSDCESAREHYEGMDVWWCGFLAMYVGSSDFCCWGKRREDA